MYVLRLTLEYASTTWNPYLKDDKHKIDARQLDMWLTDIT